ncbi:Death domain-containing protein 1 [Mactra antiquata]
MSTDIDIQAYRMLTTEIEKLTKLPTPPDDLTDTDKFKDDINKVFQDAANTVVKVKDYADEVMKKLQEIRQALKDYNSAIGKAIKDALKKLCADVAANKSLSVGRQHFFKSQPKNRNLEALGKAHALEEVANALANNRLDELTKETEKYMAKLQGGAQLTESDINGLSGNCEAFLNKAKRSFEEQQRIQEEEKQRKEKEEAERLIQQEQKRMKKEKEEKERKEKEEREKLEAELRRRNDPNYWPYFVYEIDDNDTGERGVCIFTCTDANYKKDDIQCTVRDSKSLKNILEPGETLVSKLFRLLPKNGQMSLEVDVQVYINHIAILNTETEVCVKRSVNDGPWKTFTSLDITKNIVIKDSSLQFAGVKINNFHDARMLVIVRARSFHVNMGKEGGVIRSRVNKYIKLHVPSNAFDENTNVSLLTSHASSNRVATINSALKGSKVTSANHVITVNMDRPSNSNLQVFLPTEVNGSDSADDVIHRLVRTTNGQNWIPAALNNGSDSVSLSLPSGSDSYKVVEVSLPKRFTHDDALTVVDTVYDHVNRTDVILLLHQLESDPRRARLQCVEHTFLRNAIKMMRDDGYTYGCQQSNVFHLRDGQEMHIFFSGNIARDSNEDCMLKMLYFSYVQHSIQDINLAIVNKFQQSGLKEYRGTLTCHIMEPGEKPSAERRTEYTVTIPMTLPRAKCVVAPESGLSYYMKHLARFLATELSTKKKIGWREFVKAVTGDLTFNSLNRRAINVPGDIDKCAFILQEWMNDSIELLRGDSIPPEEELIGIIIGKLVDLNLSKTEKRCQSFLQVMREQLSDDSLMDLVSVWNGNIYKAGGNLGFSKKRNEEHTKGIKEPQQQLFALLRKWRASDAALKAGSGAIDMLKNILGQ